MIDLLLRIEWVNNKLDRVHAAFTQGPVVHSVFYLYYKL